VLGEQVLAGLPMNREIIEMFLSNFAPYWRIDKNAIEALIMVATSSFAFESITYFEGRSNSGQQKSNKRDEM
jgi:hypothetical protein